MNILFMSPRFPYPTLKGDQLIVYQRIKELSEFFDITLLTFYEDKKDLDEIDHLKQFCSEIVTVRLSRYQTIKNVVTGLFSSNLPLQVSYFQSKKYQQELDRIIRRKKIDLIHTYTLRLSEYTKGRKIPVVYELIDSMQLNIENMVREERLPKKWIYKIEQKRMAEYEDLLCKNEQFVSVVAEKDKERIAAEHIRVIPNGVDLSHFRPSKVHPVKGTIIFTGNMGYLPNVHAVRWFIKYCFPIVKEAIPYATFKIVGANPSAAVKSLHNNKSVIVTGYVESIVEELNKAELSVAPMRSGSGMQNKILEAMACGLPVVTTHNGLEGIWAEPGDEIWVADTPETFAQAVISVLSDSKDYKIRSEKARKYVEEHHSWKTSNKKVIDLYLDALSENKIIKKLARNN